MPRTADGKPNLTAPAPRTGDGKPDLSGVWQPVADGTDKAGGVEGIVAPRYLIDITRYLKPEEVPFQPWAAALYKQRNDNFRRDNPLIRCLPAGVPRLIAYTASVQDRADAGADRDPLRSGDDVPSDFPRRPAVAEIPQPSWMGTRSGDGKGDVLVVETIGFNDKTWLDGSGHPHSEEMRLSERFTRRDFGHLDIAVVIDDPKTYTKPLTYVQPQVFMADTDLIEFVCAENAKEIVRPRYSRAQGLY